MVKATEVVYKYYEVEFALKRGNNDALAWFGLFLAGINKSWAKLGGMPLPRDIAINRNSIRRKVSPLGGVYLSFALNWEECRRRDLLL